VPSLAHAHNAMVASPSDGSRRTKGWPMRDKAMIGPMLEVCADNLFLVLGKIRRAGVDSPEAVHWL